MSPDTAQVMRDGLRTTNQLDQKLRTNPAAIQDAQGAQTALRNSLGGTQSAAQAERSNLANRSSGSTTDTATATSASLEQEVQQLLDESAAIEKAVADAAQVLELGKIENDRIRDEIIADIAQTMRTVAALRAQPGNQGNAEARQLLMQLLKRIQQKNVEAAQNAQAAVQKLMGIASGLGESGSTSTSSASAVGSPPAAFNAVGSGGAGGGGGGAGGGAGGGGAGAVSKPRLPIAIPPQPGTGVKINLPNGSTVEAPNPTAAKAVRQAISQLGVPYVWGGTTPGVGLDCSGLTMTSYAAGGLEIPRLAQEQTVGAEVPSMDQLVPGDLVVWSGHVAMVIGDGLMIEAGDPVQINPIRTTNAGQAFIGFYRPTG